MDATPTAETAPREAPPADRIRERLEQAILLGELADGERLDEQRLAERFGVSRTPVREALQALAATRLVERRPNRGTFVRLPDALELAEMFEVMAELEALCGRLAARRAEPADLRRLEAIAADCERAAGDSDAYYRENERLHAALYALSGNRFLAGEAATLHRRLQGARRLQLRVPRRVRDSIEEHRAIVAALAAGDAERAAACLRDHVAVQGERFADLLAHGARAARVPTDDGGR